ncbi:MAG: terpene cyclase/mutase family protein [Planctomycetes bacterium]|nr:terpene cyclase/mutase family protein [Planctomycetota bacterium]
MRRNHQEIPEETTGVQEQQYGEEGFDFNIWMQGAMKHTPWWAMSFASHVLVGLILAAIYVPADAVAILQPVIYKNMEIPKDKIEFNKEEIFKNEKIETDEVIDPTIRPDVEISTKDETDNNEEFEMAKGADDMLSNSPLNNEYYYDSVGIGGGSGGKFGGRFGGNDNTKKGGTPRTNLAVMSALRWLAKHQSPDGSWDADGFSKMCKDGICAGNGYPENDIGVTGLSLLAFLGYGFTHLTKDQFDGISYGEVIKKGLKWLIAHQDKDGCFGPQAGKFMYNHCIGTLALVEAYGMTESNLFKEPAQRGINFISRAQNPYKAWRYQVQPGDNDTSVTGWAVMAFKSAKMAGLNVPQSGFDGALGWIKEVTDESYYSVGYDAKGTGKVYVKDMNENWAGHEALTAVGMMCRIFITYDKSDPALEGGAKLISKDLPVWDVSRQTEKPIDYYYWYYAALAIFQYDGPTDKDKEGGKYWQGLNNALENALVPSQKQKADGCRFGSWDSDVDRWGFEGGRVYATAINALTLEIYYRYPNAFTGGEKKKVVSVKEH